MALAMWITRIALSAGGISVLWLVGWSLWRGVIARQPSRTDTVSRAWLSDQSRR